MDAAQRTLSRSPRWRTIAFVGLTSVGVLAGGTGGYFIRATTAAQQGAPAPAVVAPVTAPNRALNADSSSGYGTTSSAGAPTHALNSDSKSGY